MNIYLRSKKYRDLLLNKTAKSLFTIGIRADHVTYFRTFLVIPAVLLIPVDLKWTVLLILISYLLDGLDGVLARLSKPTDYGADLDFIVDKLFVVPLLVGLICFGLVDVFWAILYLLEFMILFFGEFLKKHTFEYGRYIIYIGLFIKAFTGSDLLNPILVFLVFYQIIYVLKVFYGLYFRNKS